MRGQLFILTLFLIAGLILSLSTFLSGFTQPDLSLTFRKDEPYYTRQIFQLYQKAISKCMDSDLEYLYYWLNRQELPGIYFQLTQIGDCSRLQVNLTLLGSRTNTTAQWIFK